MKFKLLLLAVILVGLALRIWAATGKTIISHDEAFTYLGAAGSLGHFQAIQEGGSPGGEWVAAAEWQLFLTADSPLVSTLQTIARDQATIDIHPPLYFWLLHLWARMWGIAPWVGPTLNIIFFVIGAPALYRLARHLLQDEQEAVLVTLVWALSPAVLRTSAEARQYDLLGVLAILFIWLLAVCLNAKRSPTIGQWLLLGTIAAAGNLTHYHFILVVAGGILVWGWRHIYHEGRVWLSRPLLIAIAVIVAGYITSFLLHPTFLTSFKVLADRQVVEAAFFLTPLDVMRRIYATADTFSGFWVYGWPLQVALFILFLSGIAFLGLVLARNRQRLNGGLKQVKWTGSQALLLCLWLGGISILMYLTFISPIHAMTSRHMAAVWPFYAFLPVFLIRAARVKWPRLAHSLPAGLAILIALFGTLSVWQANRQAQTSIADLAVLEAAPALLVDTVHWGVLPQLLIHVPPDKQLFAARQPSLLERPEAWLSELPDGSLYLSDDAYGNTAENRDQILALLSETFDIQPHEASIPGVATAYLLQRHSVSSQ